MNAPDEGEKPNVSKEEQALYDMVVMQAQATIYNEHGVQAVLQKLSATKDNPALGIGHTAAMILRSVSGGLKKAGVEVPDDVLFHAGTDLVSDLTELAVTAKLVPEADSDKVAQEAFFQGLKTYGDMEIESGKLTPEHQKAAQRELDGAKELAPVAAAMHAGMREGDQPQPQAGLLQQGAPQ